MDIQIEGRKISVRPEWKTDIAARVADLCPARDMTHVRVTLTRRDHRKLKDSYDALIVAHIPGHTITARKRQNSFEGAIRETFAAVKTELERVCQKRRSREIRLHTPPERGVVSKIFPDKGYGFITWANGVDVYFHRNALQGLTFEEIEEGRDVHLDVEPGAKGLQATTVQPVTLMTLLYGHKMPAL